VIIWGLEHVFRPIEIWAATSSVWREISWGLRPGSFDFNNNF